MPTKKKKPYETDTEPRVLAAYKKMAAAVSGVGLKGSARPYTSVNGHMFSAINRDDIIGLRLSKTDLAAFLKKYDNGLYEGHPGFFLKEYAAIPADMLSNTRTLRSWFKKSYDHVSGLKPKATTRKKK